MKAYLLRSIQQSGHKPVKASTPSDPSIIDLPPAEFKRLADMGVVREPTEKEWKIFSATTAEPVEEPEEDPSEGNGTLDTEALAARFEELFDKKPGNMKPETMAAKIAEKEAEDGLGI